jgi:hypothetical protein
MEPSLLLIICGPKFTQNNVLLNIWLPFYWCLWTVLDYVFFHPNLLRMLEGIKNDALVESNNIMNTLYQSTVVCVIFRPVHITKFTSDGLHIMSCSDDNSVIIWDMATEEQVIRYNEHQVSSLWFYGKQAWWPRWFVWGLVGFADFADGYYTTIEHQKVPRFEPRPCTTPPLTPKSKDSNSQPCNTPRSTGPPKVNSNPRPCTPHHIDPQK